MRGLRSAQGRVGAAVLVLLVLLGSVAVAAAWRAEKDQAMLDSVGRRTTAAAAIGKGRSEYFHSATQLTAAVLAEDPTPLIDSFHQGVAEGDQAVFEARGELAALGDTDTVAALDSFIEELQQQLEEVDIIFDSAAASNVPLLTFFSQPRSLQIWDRVQTQLAELDGLANEQEAKLAAERAAADRSAEATLALMLGLSAFAFLVGAAALIGLLISVVRPLGSLQESARAVAGGDLGARARVAGPEEVASLARDFNEMVAQRKQAEEALRESEAKYRSIFESIQDVFYQTDAKGVITEISPSIERVGYTREQLIGTPVLDVYEDPDERSALLKALLEQGGITDHEVRLKRADGRSIFISVSAHVLRGPDGSFSGVAGTLRNVSDRKAAEEALRESEERYRGIFESFQDIYFRTDIEGVLTEVSPSVERWGYSREELIGRHVTEIYQDPGEFPGLLKALLEQGEVSDYEIRLKTAEGQGRADSVNCHVLRRADGTIIGAEGSIRDINDRKVAEEALREQARRDPLTGALNHGAIVKEIRDLISRGEQAAPWALAMIDVNHLKAINDTCGHQVGDAALVAIAAALSRDDALVGRYGGDEFVAILPGADRAAAEGYRGKATDALADATVTDPQTGGCVPVAASIGLAIYPEDGSTLVDLIKTSDDAMYAAKRQRPIERRASQRRPRGKKAA